MLFMSIKKQERTFEKEVLEMSETERRLIYFKRSLDVHAFGQGITLKVQTTTERENIPGGTPIWSGQGCSSEL